MIKRRNLLCLLFVLPTGFEPVWQEWKSCILTLRWKQHIKNSPISLWVKQLLSTANHLIAAIPVISSNCTDQFTMTKFLHRSLFFLLREQDSNLRSSGWGIYWIRTSAKITLVYRLRWFVTFGYQSTFPPATLYESLS